MLFHDVERIGSTFEYITGFEHYTLQMPLANVQEWLQRNDVAEIKLTLQSSSRIMLSHLQNEVPWKSEVIYQAKTAHRS